MGQDQSQPHATEPIRNWVIKLAVIFLVVATLGSGITAVILTLFGPDNSNGLIATLTCVFASGTAGILGAVCVLLSGVRL